ETAVAALYATLEFKKNDPTAGLHQRRREYKIPISKSTIRIIEKCLRPTPAERYANTGELIEDLQRVIEGKLPLAKILKVKRPRRWLWGVGGAAAAAA